MSHEPQGKKQKSTTASRALATTVQRSIRRQNRGNSDVAEWRDCSPELLLSVVSAITERGCAVQFGYTRDRGAYAIRIVGDGEPYNEYVRPTESLQLYLEGLLDDFTNGDGGSDKQS